MLRIVIDGLPVAYHRSTMIVTIIISVIPVERNNSVRIEIEGLTVCSEFSGTTENCYPLL